MRMTKELQSKVASYFIQRLHCVPHNTGWLRQGTCPNCGKTKKFGINIWLDRSNCFSCAYHPRPILLVAKLENLETYNEVFKFLQAFDGADYLELPTPMLEEKEVHLPESFTLLSLGADSIGNMARNYMEDRGYDVDELTLRGVGYCSKGPYAFRIIIPYYAKGELVYFNARQFVQFGPKHKNPGREEFGIGKSQLIYNIDALHKYTTVYGVESATNALTLGDNAIAFGGKLVSDYQLSKVLDSPVKRFIMLWDPDAIWEAFRLALRICEHKQVKVVRIPMEFKGKHKPDVNDMGRNASLRLSKQFTFENYSALYRRFVNEPRPVYHDPIA